MRMEMNEFHLLALCGVDSRVELPRSPPKLWAHRDRYELGDQLLANCTAPPAIPPAQLSFTINNETVPTPGADTTYRITPDRETWSVLSLSVQLDQRHFLNNGRLTLQCTATLPAGFEVKSEPQELGIRPSEPVPERGKSFVF
ncbi:Protein RhsD [Frankliniella fusca]|uniref:Protein RhsD n=1 Tax=Frankliniella fusca TaxID=407009 RepID=A0AAE1H916_9NEOP|nr:Protein RhsD [Frankliniella fusca]